MNRQDAVKKALDSIQVQTSLTAVQVDVINLHLEAVYGAGYDEAESIICQRPRPVQQWHKGALIKTWPSCKDAANSLGLHHGEISRRANFKYGRTYKGYEWRFI